MLYVADMTDAEFWGWRDLLWASIPLGQECERGHEWAESRRIYFRRGQAMQRCGRCQDERDYDRNTRLRAGRKVRAA